MEFIIHSSQWRNSYRRQNLWVFWENDPQEVIISKNPCYTFINQTASFKLSYVDIGSQVWAEDVAKK